MYARKIDLELFNYAINNSPADTVLKELLKYQNDDGGFGNALEPDARVPESSPLATTVAMQYVSKKLKENSTEKSQIINSALNYFDSTYQESTMQWFSYTEQVNDYPHAPWWEFKDEDQLSDENWGNPTVEVLGYINKYCGISAESKYYEAFQKAKDRLKKRSYIEQHELLCYVRFYDYLSEEDQDDLYDIIETHLLRTVETDPSKWGSYLPMPLDYIKAPSSPFISKFEKSIKENLKLLIESQQDDGGWYPTWDWSGNYPNEWKGAKKEWAGYLTAQNMITLDRFNLIMR